MAATGTKEVRIRFGPGELSGLVDAAAEPVAAFALAHGANNDMRHPFFGAIARAMSSRGISVLRFNFPYQDAGRRYPDRPPVLLDAWRAVLADVVDRTGLPVAAGGKSMGGRIASVLAAEEGDAFAARALVFFGYPLHAPGRPEQIRTEHLPRVPVPMLFIEGTADPLARFDLVQSVVDELGSKARLHVVEGGDHSFRVRGRRRPDEEIGEELAAAAAAFVLEVVG